MPQLYDLVNKKGGVHFSPFAWRALLSLKHKNIDFEHIGLTFTEINKNIPELTKGKWNRIPVLRLDNGSIIYDSPKIADYLDKTYPENPLFPNGKNFATFLDEDSFGALSLYKCVILDELHSLEDKEDINYFRTSREQDFKITLEEFAGKKEDHKQAVELFLKPLSSVLSKSKFLEGEQPTYSDYIMFGWLKFTKTIGPNFFDEIVTKAEDQTVHLWFDSIENLYGGFAKSYKSVGQ